MLRRLRFQNFKSWPEVDLELGQITGLFGTNSSGKTSLIQFLLMLKQTKDATDRTIPLDLNGPYVALGAYRDLIHGHDQKLPLAWSLSIEFGSRSLTLLDPAEKRSKAIVSSKDLTIESEVRARDFPNDPRLANFDPSDRKFAAAARKAAVPVANAVDSDWLVHISALRDNGIAVEFVCGSDPSKW